MTKARLNPFNMQRVERIRYAPQGTTWPRLLEKLADMRYRAAIVGWHGAGKTTMLETLAEQLYHRQLPTAGFRFNDQHRLPTAQEWKQLQEAGDQQKIVLIDGSEQLSWLTWRRILAVTQNARGIIITTHRPHRLPTWYECHTSPQLLARIVRELVGDQQPKMLGCDQDLESLFHRHQGNLRDALRELYDCVANGTTTV